ncbi:MAG: hypothetical protein QM621_11840 [Aeromicrobium sp.]|uniref:hypothetical protein n=1 Tax=Aeromicrobium sp. TaxID=1871063 RepID=UPI0039E5095D
MYSIHLAAEQATNPVQTQRALDQVRATLPVYFGERYLSTILGADPTVSLPSVTTSITLADTEQATTETFTAEITATAWMRTSGHETLLVLPANPDDQDMPISRDEEPALLAAALRLRAMPCYAVVSRCGTRVTIHPVPRKKK